MLTTRHPVDFPYTHPELEAIFQYARAPDVERGGRYDARSACILLWSHHWLNDAGPRGVGDHQRLLCALDRPAGALGDRDR